jgi:thioredoxin-related protein
MAGIALCLTSRAFGADAAYELVMVEEHGCPWCARWNAEIGPIYPKTPEGAVAPLRRLDITELSKATLAVEKRVVFTPTFILARDGAEIGRIEGYPGEELFWWFLAALMTDNNLTVGGDTK